jgi:3-ketoacyl-CoA synthase
VWLLCFAPAGIQPEEIDILVTNCSIYCPTPSLASMLVNKFKLRQDVQAYHLGGMGCGNGVMAMGLIKDLLQVRRGVHVGCMCFG